MDLVSLTPGVTEADDQCSTGCTGTNFVSNGSRNSTADVLMDGATITNYEPNGGITNVTYTPSSEAVDEFRVEQSNFSAEYGFSGASVVNMITRSGSNAIHGEGYDFIRNTDHRCQQLVQRPEWSSDSAGASQQLRRHFLWSHHQEQDLLLLRLRRYAAKLRRHLSGGRAHRCRAQ